jgi:glycine/D-amino acid oxidase-like deaminating enzyme
VAAAEEFIAESRGAAWILTGFSGHGFNFGPLIGEALAEVVGGRRPADQFGRWMSGRPGAMREPVLAG